MVGRSAGYLSVLWTSAGESCQVSIRRPTWDHPICFLDRTGRAVALAGQPYSDSRAWDTLAAEHGSTVSIPPNPMASIHCHFAIIHPPGVNMTCLPEQLTDIHF
jgi:hypothetical protein